MDIELILGILFVHFFADFVCQTDEQAEGKSSSWEPLLSHTGVYSLIWLFILIVYNVTLYGIPVSDNVVNFVIITFICHTITDYITSRESKKSFDKHDYHNGFVVIGFDQWLHAVQLLLTYKFLF